MRMIEQLARKIDRLDQAGFKEGEIALIISEYEEKFLLDEIKILSHMKPESAHKGTFMGWPIIVEGK